MSNYLIQNVQICIEDGRMINGEILVKDGKIASISESKIAEFIGEVIDGKGCVALPGFIDIHIHGATGADFMDGEIAATKKIAEYLPQEGTTSFLATTITHSSERIKRAIEVNSKFLEENEISYGAEMLGFHLEGPFIHPEQAGAQPVQYIQKPSIESLQKWFGEQLTHLKVVTLAPELDEAHVMLQYLREKGVISSAGHSKASYKEINDAARSGLTHLTHYTNAMTGIHHREIGMVGAGFMNESLCCEIIADGIHLSDDMLRLVFKVIGSERIILITDSMRAKGLPDGNYSLGDQEVKVVGRTATLKSGTLAGSVLKMNEGVKKIQNLTDLSLHELVKITSTNAARRLGVDDRKGSLAVGKDADIVLLNDSFEVQYTFCRGRLSYSNEQR
ncbi:MAG: N-acetylglucosamine-6-phosphate deacetylase [Psychrobacillus sp.]